MTYEQAKEFDEQFLRKVFRGHNYRPFRLPIYEFIPAPEHSDKHLQFIKLYEQNNNWKEYIHLFQECTFETYCVFKQQSGLLSYVPLNEIIRDNKFHISYSEEV